MKKIIILFCIFLSSCNGGQNHPNCSENSELNSNSGEKIYWSFYNISDKKCYYLGFLGNNFFLISDGDPYLDNLLFDNYEDFIQDFSEKYIHSFHETPAFHNYYDIFTLYQQALQKHHITLAESENTTFFASENIDEIYKNSINPILEKSKNTEAYYESPVFSPSLHSEMDIKNFYNTLYFLQK